MLLRSSVPLPPLSFSLRFSPSLHHPPGSNQLKGKELGSQPATKTHRCLLLPRQVMEQHGAAMNCKGQQVLTQQAAQPCVPRNRIREREGGREVLSGQILVLQEDQLSWGEEGVLVKEKDTFTCNHSPKTATLLYYNTWYYNVIKNLVPLSITAGCLQNKDSIQSAHHSHPSTGVLMRARFSLFVE